MTECSSISLTVRAFWNNGHPSRAKAVYASESGTLLSRCAMLNFGVFNLFIHFQYFSTTKKDCEIWLINVVGRSLQVCLFYTLLVTDKINRVNPLPIIIHYRNIWLALRSKMPTAFYWFHKIHKNYFHFLWLMIVCDDIDLLFLHCWMSSAINCENILSYIVMTNGVTPS